MQPQGGVFITEVRYVDFPDFVVFPELMLEESVLYLLKKRQL
jgi:hypothetical protein